MYHRIVNLCKLYYQSPVKLWKGNIFSHVCDCTPGHPLLTPDAMNIRTVTKRAVGIRLKCLLVFNVNDPYETHTLPVSLTFTATVPLFLTSTKHVHQYVIVLYSPVTIFVLMQCQQPLQNTWINDITALS